MFNRDLFDPEVGDDLDPYLGVGCEPRERRDGDDEWPHL